MRNITAGMVRSFLDEGLTDFFRIETDGVYAKLRANPEQLPQDVLDELTLGLGLEAVHTPLCRLPCSFAEFHELAAEFGAPLNWSAIAKDEHGALSCPVDGEEYRRLYGLDALMDYQGLPADPVPLPQWLQAFAGEVARTRGHAPWSDEWIGVLAEVGDLVERHADTFPAVIEPTLRRAPAPIACADTKLRVRPADAAAWLTRHAPGPAAEVGLSAPLEVHGTGLDGHDASAADDQDQGVAADANAGGPAPLTNEQIALSFGELVVFENGLRGFLGKRVPKWLEPALSVRGKRGLNGHQWNPVKFAELLRDKKGVPEYKLDHRFLNVDALKPWSASWSKSKMDRAWKKAVFGKP